MMRFSKFSVAGKTLNTLLLTAALLVTSLTPLGGVQAARASTVTGITSKAALVSAISAATAGDTLVLGSDIVVDSAAISIAKNVTIDGNGYTATVPNVGVLDDGTNSTSASTWGVFNFASGSTGAVVRNLTIKGGNSATGAVYVAAGLSITIQSCTISNSRNSGAGGGGIKNAGTLYLKDSNVVRNSASYGGGFQNSNTIFIDGSSFAENRSESSGGGGGAGENTGSGSYLYVNNSTFANNVSSEIGGAINNYQGNLYAVNSTFTGNVTVSNSTYGGAIGKNGGTVKVANSLFAYNYSRTGGTSAAPTSYQLDDIDYGAVTLAYSMYHGVVQSGSTKVQDVQYTAAADGSNDTIFSGGTNAKVTDGTGAQVGTATVFRPALTSVNGHRVVAIKSGSLPIGIGTPTYFGSTTARLSYYDRLASTPAWVSMLGAATSSDLITTDALGVTRSATTPTVGAVETGAAALYVVKSIATADGTVDGGASIYGNTYASGSSVTVTALPVAGKVFSKWQVVVGTAASVDVTSNPYTFTVSANVTLTPVFTTAPVNTYTVSYSANGATSGTPPSAQTFTVGGSAIVTSANSGNLARTGYSFGGWSTLASGSGTIYVAGTGSFTPTANTTLYAYWVPPSVPSITVGSASYSLTTGSSATITPVNSGGSATSWSITPSAPAGMTFGTSTGVLTGAPSSAQGSTSYTITATNVAGSATATFSIAISDPVTIYTVTYNYNSATGGNSTPSASFTVGGSAVTLPTPTRTGYSFGGWYSDSGLTNSVGAAGTQYSPSSNVTLYAKWTANNLVVTFQSNGGSNVSNGATVSGGSISSAPTPPTKAGYDFVGWYADAGLTTSVSFPYVHGQLADFTLYAKWAAATYTVTYNYNSATGGNSALTANFTTGGSAVTLPTPTRTGYSFGGWYSDSGLTSSVGLAGASFTTAASITLYAKWIGNAYTVTYIYNSATGGNTATSASFTVGGSAVTLPTPTRTGYSFGGWYSDSGLTSSVGSAGASYSPMADATLYAKWTPVSYTVTYNYNLATSGNTVNSDTYVTDGSAIALPTPSRSNFVFDGWFDALSGGNVIGAAGASFTTTSAVTLYAHWTQASLSGISTGDLVSVGSLVASDSIGVEFGATASGSSVHVSVPAGALPNGTTITMNLLNNFTHAQTAISGAHDYVLSLVVSWLTTDGFVPTTNTGKSISMTITNSSIKAGDAVYVLVHGVATLVGRATTDGQALVEITDDPEIVIASTRPFAVTNVTATDGDDGSSTISWLAPTIDGGSVITGYTVTSSGGQTCLATLTSCTITGLTNGTSYTFTVIATNAVGSSTSATSSAITPAAVVNTIQNVTPPVTAPVTPPVTTPVTPPVTTPVTPPVTTPVTTPVTPTVPSVVTPIKALSFGSSAIGVRLSTAQISQLKALKAKKGFTVKVFTSAKLNASSLKTLQKIASRVTGAINVAFTKFKAKASIQGASKVACKAPNGVCLAITATK